MPHPHYDPAHDHGLDDVAGYDVIHSTWSRISGEPQPPTRLTVTAVVHGARRYGEALTLAQAHRRGLCTYGYVASRYTDGCRSIADVLRPVGPWPAPEFTDYDTGRHVAQVAR